MFDFQAGQFVIVFNSILHFLKGFQGLSFSNLILCIRRVFCDFVNSIFFDIILKTMQIFYKILKRLIFF